MMLQGSQISNMPFKSHVIVLFDRRFKKKINGFLFVISFFVLEILTFFYYAN